MLRRRLIALAVITGLALFLARVARADPDSHGEDVVATPSYRGERANAPIPSRFHVRNEGGSDGAGLCVISSITCNGAFQGVKDLLGLKDSPLWRAAKRAPGGYSPDKLRNLLDRLPGLKDEKYASYIGTDTSVLDRWSRRGYPIGATMNTGQLYSYRYIHHMISLIHYRKGGYAIVVDNNDTGRYHVMPAGEFDRRWPYGGTAWAFIWTRLPALRNPVGPKASCEIGFLLVAVAVVLVAIEPEPEPIGVES